MQIIKALSDKGLGRFWSQPTGAAYRDNTLVRYGVIGSADISGILIGGIRVEIEVKTGQATQSDQQKNFERMIKMFGGIYIVAHSVDEALDFLQAAAPPHEVR